MQNGQYASANDVVLNSSLCLGQCSILTILLLTISLIDIYNSP